jgi:uncharacterized protein YrzB (UPF0473 family)
MEGKETISLSDENGNSIEYEVLDIIEIKNNFYTVLYQADGKDTEVSIFRVEDTPDNKHSQYIMETDENIINEVYNKFRENYRNDIRFLD